MGEAPFAVVDRPDLSPTCPHCKTTLTEVFSRRQGTAFVQGRTLVFFCSHCRAVLGFGKERMI